MRSSTYLALFAGSAAAQSSVSLFNLFEYQATLTQIGADATATTYKNDCPASNAGISALPPSLRPTADGLSAAITPAPTPTPRVRLARQASASGDDSDYSICEPYTLKQGPSTWEFHMTDPLPGAWTVDVSCKWQGAITNADLTCTGVGNGYVVNPSARGAGTTVYSKDEFKSMDAVQAVAIVTASGAASASASQTPSGSGSAARSGASAPSNAASGSGAAASARSTGFAPAGPLPTGAMALVGGAAGVFAAALAL